MNEDKDINCIELDIEGMDCPACALKIEKTVSRIEGIKDVKVNLGSETASITFTDKPVDFKTIKTQIDKLGYKALEPDIDFDEEEADREKAIAIKRLRTKIAVSLVLSVIIVLLGMKEHIGLLTSLSQYTANWISLPLSTIVVFWCGLKFHKGFWIALKNKSADMDTLISVGTLSAYIYSVFILIFPHSSGDHGHTVYFESAAMIVTFILLGNYLEANLKNKTQYAIRGLTSLQSKFATIIRNGNEFEIPIKRVKLGDIVLVKPGERIPVDGTVTEGASSVDESMITGESVPAELTEGKKVTGGTMNLYGYLKIKTEKVGKDSFLAKIINLVKDAQKSKPKIQRIGDKVASVFVPIVILIAIATFGIWYLWVGQEFSYSLLKAVAVLIIACPCALGLATPIAIVLGVGRAAEHKILFNNAEAIENVNKVRTIVFDKTGTLTYAKFEVTSVKPMDGGTYSGNEVLKLAASLEKYSEHPIAKAIVQHYKAVNGDEPLYIVQDFKVISGIGVEAAINGNKYKLGGANLIKSNNFNDKAGSSITNDPGLILFENDKSIGEIEINDRVKEDAYNVIKKLKDEHYKISMISGDSRSATEKIANELDISDYHYQILPDRKQEIIMEFQKRNEFVAMVGDGINDAPSLSSADLGIAIGTGQDIAIQSADVILVKGELRNLLALFKISIKTIRIIKQNLFWAFFYNAAAIPLAAGVLVPWGISISPVMASMFMALSDVITVIGNSLRLKYMKVN